MVFVVKPGNTNSPKSAKKVNKYEDKTKRLLNSLTFYNRAIVTFPKGTYQTFRDV